MNGLNNLGLKLVSLTVFRDLLEDDVIGALSCYLTESADTKTRVSEYCEFVSRLYNTQSHSLSEHIRDIVNNSSNVYVRMIGSGKTPDEHIKMAVDEELKILQEISDITSEVLCDEPGYEGYLPGFTSGGVDIRESFEHRVSNIAKYGYGVYAKNKMFCLDANERIIPVKNPDSITLDSLIDYERERGIILDNTKALLEGKPAANILLTGDAGTGKSSTIKAVVNELYSEGLRIIELRKDQLRQIPAVLDELSENPLKFILFIDDLSFLKDDDNFNALKAALEGSVCAKSDNVVIYATSNRRHIVKENFSDREGDDVHRNDTMQEMISLSERFGIHISFRKPDKNVYLNIVHHMAKEKGINIDEAELDLLAERFALERGGRSARHARQFIDGLIVKCN